MFSKAKKIAELGKGSAFLLFEPLAYPLIFYESILKKTISWGNKGTYFFVFLFCNFFIM